MWGVSESPHQSHIPQPSDPPQSPPSHAPQSPQSHPPQSHPPQSQSQKPPRAPNLSAAYFFSEVYFWAGAAILSRNPETRLKAEATTVDKTLSLVFSMPEIELFAARSLQAQPSRERLCSDRLMASCFCSLLLSGLNSPRSKSRSKSMQQSPARILRPTSSPIAPNSFVSPPRFSHSFPKPSKINRNESAVG